MTKKSRFVAIPVVAAILVGTIAYFSLAEGPTQPQTRGSRPTTVPVVVANAETQTVPITFNTVAAVESIKTVAVKSRVDGQIVAAKFAEGQEVHANDLLYKIDPRPVEASLKMAEATLARDQAQLTNAKRNLDRYTSLSDKGFATRQQLDDTTAQVAVLEASLRSDTAAIELAKLQIEYTDIRSPVDGITGAQLISPGNLVKANDTNALVVINQVRPIYVSFSMPENLLPQLRGELASGHVSTTITIPGDTGPAIVGELTFVDNAVDPSTGTIKLKATFANADERLTPGLFVNAQLTVNTLKDAIVVPSQAVAVGQKGNYVYVVGGDNLAQMRPVVAGPVVNGMTVINSGVAAGDKVVVDGQLRLVAGIAVNARADTASTSTASSTASRGE